MLTSVPILEVISGLAGYGGTHFERCEHEMDEVIAIIYIINVGGTMSNASKSKLNWCTKLGLQEYFKRARRRIFMKFSVLLIKRNKRRRENGSKFS